jgi:hypothetical protein
VLISWILYQEASLRSQGNPGKYVRGSTLEEYAQMTFSEKVRCQIDNFLEPSVELAERWIETREQNSYEIEVKITRFEDMIGDPDRFFANIFDFYGVSDDSLLAGALASVRRSFSTSTTNKKRGSDVDEWEEYFSPSLKQDVVNAIPQSIIDLYPD